MVTRVSPDYLAILYHSYIHLCLHCTRLLGGERVYIDLGSLSEGASVYQAIGNSHPCGVKAFQMWPVKGEGGEEH